MNKTLKLLLIALTCGGGVLQAREMRTPLPTNDWRGYFHYPLGYSSELNYEGCNYLDIWGAGYSRYASRAFGCKTSTSKVPLATLIFGQPNFNLAQIFPNGTSVGPLVLPTIDVSRLEYNERGAVFGAIWSTKAFSDCYRMGIRGRLPVRFVTVRRNTCCAADAVVTPVENFCCDRNEYYTLIDDPANKSYEVEDVYACRLDFLSTLHDDNGQPLVQYVAPGTGRITFGSIDGTNGNSSTGQSGPEIPGAKIYAYGSPDGSLPTPPYGTVAVDANVNGFPVLAADGSNIGNQRMVFDANTNYAPLSTNVVNQSRIYIVPTIAAINSPAYEMTTDARVIQSEIENETGCSVSANAVVNFLTANCLSFDTQQIEGLGDFATDFFIQYDINPCMWSEGHFGVVFPSGKKVYDPRQLLLQPLGNNGHFEIRIAGEYGWDMADCVKLRADAMYSWVLRKTENIAAPFVGATIRNIGPTIQAPIRWGYFLGHVDLTFVAPCNECLGFDLGYEIYVKQRDKVCLNANATAIPFGTTTPSLLSASVIERNTKVVANKVRAEFFYDAPCANLFAGFTNVFAGKNVPQESDWYIGVSVAFD